jgi:hypothetical protein
MKTLLSLFNKCLFFLLVGLYSQNAFSQVIFYQPQNQDSSITEQQWTNLLDKVYQQGYREIVVQWTQYGTTNFVAKTGFLREVLNIAQAKKFKIWLGLYLPNDYYHIMQSNRLMSAEYFQSVLLENSKRLSLLEVHSLVNKNSFAGWYLPLELTHKYLHQGSKQDSKTILKALNNFASSVDAKIAISYFLSENTTYESALSDLVLLHEIGFELWLQKGNGLKKVTVASQLIKKMDCDIGVITENFIQTSDNNASFKAKKNGGNNALSQLNRCHKRLTFSLRYLPYSPFPLDR